MNMLSQGMKAAICMVTLLLLFLIGYVNNFMLRRKQKEFAVQTVMGMEQRTTAWLFIAETFLMGILSVFIGIGAGMLCSQFITAMLLTSFGQTFQLTFTLYPDTVLLTFVFFSVSFLLIGLGNVRTIRKIKIIDMLQADRVNEGEFKKSRWMPGVTCFYGAALCCMLAGGASVVEEYFDPRCAFWVRFLFLGNVILPLAALLFLGLWFLMRKKWRLKVLVAVWMVCAVLMAALAAGIPGFKDRYLFNLSNAVTNKYLLFLLMDLIFFICGVFYHTGGIMLAWKDKSQRFKYKDENLFFLGQTLSKLRTTTKTMTLICLTLVLSILLFVITPALVGWASGYLDARAVYDIQIFSDYHDVYDEAELPHADFEAVTAFLQENRFDTVKDFSFWLYLPRAEDFLQRVKYDYPAAAISLSDYNTLRNMRGYDSISLGSNEFTTQWQSIASKDEREEFLKEHKELVTDQGSLTLSADPVQDAALGETIYNMYTDVVYVLPDDICKGLLAVMQNRYINTAKPLSFDAAKELEMRFTTECRESGEEANFYIRTSTAQINGTKISNFILQAGMTYGAVVLLVICFTILSLQQLNDAAQYRYRFGVLRNLGVEETSVNRLILKQLSFWFGLPIVVAVLVSAVAVVYYFNMISVQITAYIGSGDLLSQIGVIIVVLVLLLLCYFLSTWLLFRRLVSAQ